MKKDIKVIELFSGIGAQKRGIDNTNVWNCEIINTSDIDKDAILSYAAVHCGMTTDMVENYTQYPSAEEMAEYLTKLNIGFDFQKNRPYNWKGLLKNKVHILKKYYLACILSNNMGDISRIDSLNYADLWTYSFPCQDISLAGQKSGIVKGGTRSGLLYEVERLLERAIQEDKAPKYLLLENVKNLVGKKFKAQFEEWCKRLEELGYNTYWQVINSKDCGIPQNRERVFAVSIRKDIDTNTFVFASKFDNGCKLRDLLDSNVDEKYNLKTIKDYFIDHSIESERKGNGFRFKPHNPSYADIAFTVTTRAGGRMDDNYVLECDLSDKPYFECTQANLKQIKGKDIYKYKIRKLTPAECWRLMGFKDTDVEKAEAMGIALGELYHQAGNSIVTNCISLIMEHLYKAQEDSEYMCTDEMIEWGNV